MLLRTRRQSIITPDVGGNNYVVTLDESLGIYDSVSSNVSINGSLPLLFSDNFESGNLSHTENGISWATAGSVAVSTQNANGGTHSAKFTMAAGSTSGAELRFDLGKTYTEWQCTFDLYIPNGAESYGGAAYTHGTSNPANNKFFRLWRGDKSDGNDGYSSVYWRIGASTERGSTSGGMSQSDLQAEYGQNGSVGPNGSNGTGPDAGSSANFIALADRGTWMSIDIYCKCATVANNNGVIRIKKNGATLINSTNLQFYPDSGNNGADFGYLLGFANSGFAADTFLFVDNVNMYAQ